MNETSFLARLKYWLGQVAGVIVKDWRWKAVALLLALTLFFGIRQSISHTQSLTLPIETELDTGSFSLKGFEPTKVRVTFRGSESEIRQLSERSGEAPRILLKLSQPPKNATETRIRITPKDIICPDGLRIVSIEPKEVVAKFDLTETLCLNIAPPTIRGAMPDTVRVTYSTPYVEVSGPSERLLDLVERQVNLQTDILDVTGYTENFSTKLAIQPPDKSASWSLNPEAITVNVEFIRDEVTHALDNVPIHILQGEMNRHYMVEPAIVQMKITGSKDELRDFNRTDPKRNDAFLVIANPLKAEKEGNDFWVRPYVAFPFNRRAKEIEVIPPRVKLISQACVIDTDNEETD